MFSAVFIKCLKCLLLIRLIFGQYIHVSKSKIIKVLLFSYCVIFTGSALFGIIKLENMSFYDFVTFIHFDVALNNVLSFIFQSKYVNAIFAMIEIPQEIFYHNCVSFSSTVRLILIIYPLRMYTCVALHESKSPFMVNCYCLASLLPLAIGFFLKTLFFNVLHDRMRLLRKKFEFKRVPVIAIGKERVKLRIENVKECLLVYDCLLRFIENMDPEIELWLFCGVITHFPKAVTYTRDAMLLVLQAENILTLANGWNLFALVYTICFGFWPMVLFEMTKNEVDAIKETLYKQSQQQTDKVLLEEIDRALQYIRMRPCEYRVCRMMTMGVGLPLTFINICMTYVIVLVQFHPVK